MPECVLISKLEDAIKQDGDFSSDDPIATYMEYVLAVPGMRPRRIERARDFSCPDENKSGLLKLEEAILKGCDLLPWMSNKYNKDNFFGKDHLMHLFAVSHFHLGEEIGANCRMKRTGNLLFALVANDVVYELAVGPHGSWTASKWQEILISNWPDAFGRYTLSPEILDVSWSSSTDEEVKKMQEMGVNTILKTTSGFSFPVGGGVTTAKTSARATVEADRLKYSLVAEEEKYLKKLGYGYKNLRAALVTIERDIICFQFPHDYFYRYLIPRNH